MKKLIILSMLFLLTKMAMGQNQNPAAVAQWHSNANSVLSSGNNGSDWIYSMIATDKKEYICVGYTHAIVGGADDQVPVIFKLDHLGNLVWIKPITSATGTSASGYSSTLTINYGIMFQVIKGRTGKYAAIGYGEQSSSGFKLVLIEFDDQGNITPSSSLPQVYDNSSVFSLVRGRTIAIDPTGSYYVVSADCRNSTGHLFATLFKINCLTGSFTYSSFPDSTYINRLVLAPDGSGSFNIYTCGYLQQRQTVYYSIDAGGGTSVPSVAVPDNDIWVTKEKGSDLSQIFSKTYNKTNMTSSGKVTYNYTETGPVSARSYDPLESEIYGSEAAGLFGEDVTSLTPTQHNVDEEGQDIIINSDGDLVISALVNFVHIDNSDPVIRDKMPFTDVRGVSYGEYTDGDGFLLKLSAADGTLKEDAKNVGHFSGGDFRLHLQQNNNGVTSGNAYLVSGSTADAFSGSGPNLPSVIGEANTFIVYTDDNPSDLDIWRRSYIGDDDAICTFDIANTADGGFIVGGNNGRNKDDFTAIKFSPLYAGSLVSSGYSKPDGSSIGTYTVSGTVNWPNSNVHSGDKIASKIIVPSGATLNINNCTLNFASSDHLYDYMQFPGDGTDGNVIGIFVQPGGKLNITNSTLQGLSDGNGDNYMWDGIIVQGNPNVVRSSGSEGTLNLNNSTIKNARYGLIVSNGLRYSASFPQSTSGYTGTNNSSRYIADGTMGGGIVSATNTTFQNCRFGVNYQAYNLSPATSIISPGYYKQCTFTCDANGMGDVCFYADPNGNPLPSNTYFASWIVSKFKMEGNTFSCDASFDASVKPIGIILGDGSMDVYSACTSPLIPSGCSGYGPSNTFSNLSVGIQAGYTFGNSAYPLIISNAVFQSNINGLQVAGSTNGLAITNNNFYNPSSSSAAITLAGCTGYELSNNNLDKCSGCTGSAFARGITISNGDIKENMIDLNTFNNMGSSAIALQTNGSAAANTGLQFHCNTFNANSFVDIGISSYIASSPVVIPGTIRPTQGDCKSSISPAGNQFFNSCVPGLSNLLYADNHVSEAIKYNANDGSSIYNPNTCKSPQFTVNACFRSATGACPSTSLYVNTTNGGNTNLTGTGGIGPDNYAAASPLLMVHHLDTSINNENDSNTRSDLITEQNLLISNLSLYYNLTGSYDSAGQLMESYGRYQEAFPFYMMAEEWANADRVLGEMPATNANDALYAYFCNKAYELYSNGQTWYNLDSADKDSLKHIVQYNSYSGYMAGAADTILGQDPITWPMPVIDSNTSMLERKAEQWNTGSTENAVNTSSFSMYPNPTTGIFTITTTENGIFALYNLQGIRVLKFVIQQGTTAIQLPDVLSAGVYIGKFTGSGNNNIYHVRLVYKP